MQRHDMFFAALAVVLMVPAGARAQTTGRTVAGEAFGAQVTTPFSNQGKTPVATLHPDSGLVEAALLSLTVAAVSDPIPGGAPGAQGFTFGLGDLSTITPLTTNELDSSTSGIAGENASTSQGSSMVANVVILQGVVRAQQVVAMASSSSTGVRATSNANGSQILGLAVNGVFMGDVTPAPNTQINVPAVGTVILNEQIPSGDGIRTSGLQVNMIHVVLKDAITGAKIGDIIVGSARSAVGFTR